MMPILTVFTPTYNRAYCLDKGYDALCRQTCKDFIWLIVDDGSEDDTRQLVSEWQKKDNGFEIIYRYQENGGLYKGYKTAIDMASTELCMCVDSDDYLADDAVEKIISYWTQAGTSEYAGIVGLDADVSGSIIGDPLPDTKSINLIDLLFDRAGIRNGDRKNIVRTDLYRAAYPEKEFPDERDFNPHYMHIRISEKYDFLVLNEVLCYVDYQAGGMTDTVLKQYLRSPKSFREMRLLELSLKDAPLGFLMKKTIHYVSSCILSGEPCISASPHKVLTVLMYPFGMLLTLYLKLKVH